MTTIWDRRAAAWPGAAPSPSSSPNAQRARPPGDVAAVVAERGALAVTSGGAGGVAPAIAEGRNPAAVGRGRAGALPVGAVEPRLLRVRRRREHQREGQRD